jgi:cytochrome oxidase Cu insertion factor (SCO1/SenC/PrrC family)
MNTIDPRMVRRRRRVLIGLALLFFAPLALAFFLYYGMRWHPSGHLNHGDLIQPALPLPELSLRELDAANGDERLTQTGFLKGKWTLLYFGPGDCPAACRDDLYDTRQVRAALGKDSERVQRVFLAQGACCDRELLKTEHPDLITVRATDEAAPLVELLHQSQAGGVADGRVYLIDPLGNLMMSYGAGAPPKGMLEDLKKLLGLSHVG